MCEGCPAAEDSHSQVWAAVLPSLRLQGSDTLLFCREREDVRMQSGTLAINDLLHQWGCELQPGHPMEQSLPFLGSQWQV